MVVAAVLSVLCCTFQALAKNTSRSVRETVVQHLQCIKTVLLSYLL
jgi:hypothetical protein